MKNIKKLIAVILTLACVLCLAGCNGAQGNDALFISGISGKLSENDVATISESLKAEFPEEEIGVVEVFRPVTNISFRGETLNIYAIDPANATYLGLEEMDDGTAYFVSLPEISQTDSEKVNDHRLQISVITEITEGGIGCSDTAYMDLNTAVGVDENGILSELKENYFMPGMEEEPFCFVSVNTINEILELSVSPEIDLEASNFSTYEIIGISVFIENQKAVSEYLATLGYTAE